jgi:DNA-directed RNA polymerase subunit H
VVFIAKKEKEFEVSQHVLVPKHTKLSEKEKKDLMDKYKITFRELPRISLKDAAISHLELEPEDIVKIERPSPTSKNTVFFRRVVK